MAPKPKKWWLSRQTMAENIIHVFVITVITTVVKITCMGT